MHLDLPQTMQTSIQYYANKQGISVNDYIVSAIQTKIDDNQDDDNALFDLDQMKKAIAGCETEELALKNGIAVPDWALVDFDSFQKWRSQRALLKATL